MNIPVIWNFAGSDSCGAAGAQADLKTITVHGCHASQVITAITSQSNETCFSVDPVSTQQICSQIAALKRGGAPSAIKIGMIGNAANLSAIREGLSDFSLPIVIDPVLFTSSGISLADGIIPADLLSIGQFNNLILTPNTAEATQISGCPIDKIEDLPKAAAKLLEMGAQAVLIKGGHLPTFDPESRVQDFYADRSGLKFFINGTRYSFELRGTGCTLASAIAANLALGHEIQDAVVLSKAYLNQCFSNKYAFDSGKNVIRHLPPVLTREFMPTATLGATPDNHNYPDSPHHRPGFYVIADSADWVDTLSTWEVPTVQLRIKGSSSNINGSLEKAVRITRSGKTALYINDHWQQAIALKSYGLHLGQEDLQTADIPAIKRAGLRLGISTHSWFEAAVALQFKPSYIALGPIFPTTCKSMRFGPQGFAKLKQWKTAWPCPVVAIGGLTLEHADDLKKMGVDGVAVISDILNSKQPEARTKDWLRALS